LEPKQAKTRIVHLRVEGEGLDFLGFHHRLVRSPGLNGKRPVTFLARWPADKAMQHARDRIRELTCRSRLLLPTEWIVEDLNRFLRGGATDREAGGHEDPRAYRRNRHRASPRPYVRSVGLRSGLIESRFSAADPAVVSGGRRSTVPGGVYQLTRSLHESSRLDFIDALVSDAHSDSA
jgi:hypothetical protein